MKSFFQPLRQLPRASRWSLVLVLVCGSVLGYFVFCTFASPLRRQYQLDFGTAQWIGPGELAPVAHFRRNVFLNAAPEQAWLEVAATDSFEVIINGKTIGTESNPKTRIAQIYDIKKYLKPGTNVIAISVTRTSYPGSAQLLVCGSFKEPSNKPNFVVSDERWQVTPKTGMVRDGGMGVTAGAGAGLAQSAAGQYRTPGRHHLGRYESAFASTGTLRQMDHKRKRIAGGSLFHDCERRPISSGDVDSSSQFRKPGFAREW